MKVRHSAWLVVCLSAVYSGCGNDAPRPDTSAGNEPPAQVDDDAASPVSTSSGSEPEPNALRPDDWFEDVTERSGVRFTHHNGREAGRFFFIESFGGGAGMADFDRDGDIDLFFTGGGIISAETPVRIAGLRSGLFRNQGGWDFVEVTGPAGFDVPPDYSQGCAVADIDVDGFPDLFVCCYGRSRLYRNQGDGTFSDRAAETGMPEHDWHTAAAFGDVDGDGLPELFAAKYTDWSPDRDVACYGARHVRDLCGPTSYSATTCQFFHNAGDGRFEDWSERAGLAGNVRGLGVVAADLNGDGWVDFYVASDESPKHLYLGGPQGRFTENAAAAGVAVGELGQPEGSMGVDIGDYNGDGLPDIFVTNFENEDCSLYRNMGEGLFLHSTVAAGLSGRSRRRVGFGTALADFDGDGWPDLFVLNGNPIYTTAETPFKQAPQLFHNINGQRFENISDQGGTFFREVHSGRGSAVGDLDDDGAPDLVAVPMNDPVRVLRNRRPVKNFVRVELRARLGEPDATGAQVSAEYDGRQIVRFAVRGTGFFSQSDPRMLFPADADAASVEVTVMWPGRSAERFPGLAVRRTHLLVEGRGERRHGPH